MSEDWMDQAVDDLAKVNLLARIAALEAENKRLRNEITAGKMLTPVDLKAVDKHCDWVAFKHAWNGVWNNRAKAAMEGK